MTLTHLGGGRAAAGAQAALLGRGVLSYARIMVRQLQSDVRLEEQVELTRLEGAASGSADEDPLVFRLFRLFRLISLQPHTAPRIP